MVSFLKFKASVYHSLSWAIIGETEIFIHETIQLSAYSFIYLFLKSIMRRINKLCNIIYVFIFENKNKIAQDLNSEFGDLVIENSHFYLRITGLRDAEPKKINL